MLNTLRTTKVLTLVPVLFLVLVLVLLGWEGDAKGSDGRGAGLGAHELRCEYLKDPLGMDRTRPRLSWVVTADRRAEKQTAYRVLVASSPEKLAKDAGDLWDSGKVASSQSAHVEYEGTALRSRQACWWKVMVWDRDGAPGAWSKVSRWEMGLLAPADWTAKWVSVETAPAKVEISSAIYFVPGKISVDVTETVAKLVASDGPVITPTNALFGGDPAVNVPKRLKVSYTNDGVPMEAEGAENRPLRLQGAPLPYLRRSFRVDKPVRSARVFATALGVYELHLNGAQVGDQILAPGWTDYRKRVLYQTFDVTSQIRAGENVLGAMVGPGWFSGHAGLFNAFQFYGKSPALLAQLELTYEDGTTERIHSDESWKTARGPLLIADLLKGETHDARAAVRGWNAPGFDDSSWAACVTRAEDRNLESELTEPARVYRELPAKSITEPKPGAWTFDIGQNMVGVVRLRIEAPRGTIVTIRHGEMLNPDGTVYTENLRAATATDVYVCAGGGVETWRPQFTFHGFRYVEVTGLSTKPSLDAVTGVAFGSDLVQDGEFVCSDPRINQLQSNINWGLRGNYLSVPTDCPQRDERMGWMADAQVFLPTAIYNAGVGPFMSKWMTDVIDAQREDGAHSDVAPVMKGLNYGTPAWADAGTIVPWEIYQAYGDKRILERSIDSMIRWVDWCKAHSNGLIREKDRGNDYGDWLSIAADTPKELIGTAYFAYSTDIVARALHVLGRQSESDRYAQLRDEIKKAFNAKYVSPDGRIFGDTQCAYVLALRFDLLPTDLRAQAADRIEKDVAAKAGHLSTGFVGVSYLLDVLTDSGKSDLAYKLLFQDSFPSWLFSVKHGATTIWERWDGWTPEGGVHKDVGMNSFNHYSLGSCGKWLFESVAGIAREPGTPGFERIVIRPRRTSALTSASGKYRSFRGDIVSSWTRKDGAFTLSVTIPANTTATVFVPAAEGDVVTESGGALDAAAGVKLVRRDSDAAVVEIGSGSYTFTAGGARGR